MHLKKLILTSVIAITVSGCAARQEISQFKGELPKNLCIAKHEEIKPGVITALQDGFKHHSIKTTVIDGTYIEKHGMWNPEINIADAKDCDGIVFYTARWNWDLALYMSYANIWVTDPAMAQKVAQATYTTRHGLDKFINARKKIMELVDSMVAAGKVG
jgi:hypothetical protein